MSTHPHSCRHLLPLAVLTLVLCVVFFAPRLWLMRNHVPGSFQWDRAYTFLLQCEQPLRTDIEPAMLWRLLPPLVAHTLHLPGRVSLVLPWIGLVAATVYVGALLRSRLDDWRFVLGGSLLFGTTSAALVPIGWLGMNDAWVWLGLLAVAFGRAAWAAPLACLLCPWVDERFLIGFPLAWLVGRLDRNEPLLGRPMLTALWLLPYVAGRLIWNRTGAEGSTATFLDRQLQDSLTILPLVPLGWWMGLRGAWGAVGIALWIWPRAHGLMAGAVLLGTLTVSWLLASDLSRSAAIALPLVLAGCFAWARRWPELAPTRLLALGLLNLAIPAAHVTYVHVDLISPLPVELYRLLR